MNITKVEQRKLNSTEFYSSAEPGKGAIKWGRELFEYYKSRAS
ncbi:MAG: DUF1724 domain-containing protein [Thermoplasmata archaeon]|nr:MAG: DUF1724 domain-containing protein [Thermoplasmata archaeon]